MAASKPVPDPEESRNEEQKNEKDSSNVKEFDSAIFSTSPLPKEHEDGEQNEGPDHDVLGLLSYKPEEAAKADPYATRPTPRPTIFTRDDRQPEKSADVAAQEEPEDYTQLNRRKVGLLGGRGVGKTYFFNGVIYRTLTEERAGSVSYYMRSSNLTYHMKPDQPGLPVDLYKQVEEYQDWTKYGPTTVPKWYRLNLKFNTGLIGKKESHLELGFLDGSGEALAQPITTFSEPIWKAAFSNAAIMIFCLPIWAAFPAELSDTDEKERKRFLEEFFRVVANYRQVRVPGLNVRSILALTMADDDRRCSLRELIERWIKPYMNSPKTYLKQLRKRSGIPRYLANAHAVSLYMCERFKETDHPVVGRILDELSDFGRGRPWIIPVSAVEGKTLEPAKELRDGLNESGLGDSSLRSLVSSAPVPVHVELPLLAALCENHNALM